MCAPRLTVATLIAAALAFALFPAGAAAPPSEEVAELARRVQGSIAAVRSGSGPVGSGVLVDAAGHVVTAAQLVPSGAAVEVVLGGVTYRAKLVSLQTLADLAVLRLERAPEKPLPAPVAEPVSPELGSRVVVISSPEAGAHALSIGHVASRRAANIIYAGLGKAELLESDAAHPGQLGAPMFDLAGHLVGVVTGVPTRTPATSGYAVSAGTIKRIVAEGVPWAGLEAMLIKDEFAGILNLPQPAGLLVQHVLPGSAAEALGLKGGTVPVSVAGDRVTLGGDVILAVGGISVADPDAGEKIVALLRQLKADSPFSVTVLRRGQKLELKRTP
ncbi:MAG: S1C family serine protease [Acidobacteria bacterium]|jgi:S1-C subfamily serine protease|nr:S1C family serine protease [Acidobacteriota bacterium]